MKFLKLWEARDKTRFDSAEKCREYEVLMDLMEEIGKILIPLPKQDSTNFSNGGSYIQQTAENVESFRMAVYNEAFPYISHLNVPETPEGLNPLGMVGKFIYECCPKTIYLQWERLMCIDSEFREWGQPYYAIHPDMGKQVAL